MAINIIDPKLKFRNIPKKRSKTDVIILHHASAKTATVEAVHSWHLQRGWAGIGYHYYVRKDGRIYRGRAETAIGAHLQGHNNNSIGICAEGDFGVEQMPDVQKQALINLVADIKKRYPKIQVKKHNDYAATACPGKNYPFDKIKVGSIAPKGGSTKAPQSPQPVKLKVDGYWGIETNKELQKYFGTPVDGYLSGQKNNRWTRALSKGAVKHGNGGSLLIKAIQRLIGARVDGLLGPETVRKLQIYLGTPVDSKISDPSLMVKEMQRRLNRGKF